VQVLSSQLHSFTSCSKRVEAGKKVQKVGKWMDAWSKQKQGLAARVRERCWRHSPSSVCVVGVWSLVPASSRLTCIMTVFTNHHHSHVLLMSEYGIASSTSKSARPEMQVAFMQGGRLHIKIITATKSMVSIKHMV
jgi:hypothetical protein